MIRFIFDLKIGTGEDFYLVSKNERIEHDVDEEVRVKQRIVPTRKRDKSNDKFRISLLVNIILAILVLAMFGITLKSDNPNILNYRKAIINEYAAWEQELTEREEQIRQKEAELGIN